MSSSKGKSRSCRSLWLGSFFLSFFPFFPLLLLTTQLCISPCSPVVFSVIIYTRRPFLFPFSYYRFVHYLAMCLFCPFFALRCLSVSQGLFIYSLTLRLEISFVESNRLTAKRLFVEWLWSFVTVKTYHCGGECGGGFDSKKEKIRATGFPSFFFLRECGGGWKGKDGCSILVVGLRKPSSPFQGSECFP